MSASRAIHDDNDNDNDNDSVHSPAFEKKPVCYRCRKGIARRDTPRVVSVWSVANRPERVTVCGACWLAPTPPAA